jgi:hypothetical protein
MRESSFCSVLLTFLGPCTIGDNTLMTKWIQANTCEIAILLKPCVDFAKGAAFLDFEVC